MSASDGTEGAPAGEHHTFPCGQCGADLTFKPGDELLECPYCGHRQEIVSEGEVVERDFRAALLDARRAPAKALVADGRAIRCEGCGAETVVAGRSDHCPFCGSPLVVADDGAQDAILPESVLPFKIDDREAQASFRAWVKKRWFAPNQLKRRVDTQGIDGVYLPYWTYDSQSKTRYTGERGTHYYVSETYTDKEGKTQTRQVRRTRWHRTQGTVAVAFDDVLIAGSETLPTKLLKKLLPWDLEGLRPYSPAYLSGFVTERYKIDLEEGWKRAQVEMKPPIEAAIRREIGGDEQRIGTMDIRHSAITFKHCLLPLWISSFRFDGKVYRVVVNARTGKVSGERPYSVGKTVAVVLLSILVIVGVVVLVRALR